MRHPRPRAKTRKVIVVTDLTRASRRDFLSGFFDAIGARFDWDLRLVQTPGEISAKTVRRWVAEGVSGAVVLDAWEAEALAALEASPISVIAVGARTGWFANRQENITFLRVDDVRLGAFAAECLTRLGAFNAFVFLPAREDDLWSRDRADGFLKALPTSRARTATVYRPSAHGPLADFLKSLRKPVAVFAACDRIAADALLELQNPQALIPRPITLLGVDDDRLVCDSLRPRLSSISPDHYNEGARAALELHALLSARAPKAARTILCAKMALHERESTAAVVPAAHLIARACEFIGRNATRGITPSDVAAYLGISRRLLDLRFGQLSEASVARTIRAAKLKAVKRELRTSRKTLSALAKDCGFANANYLKRLFLAETGLTLSGYRQFRRS